MLDLFQESIKGYNFPFTILLGVLAVYWAVALLGIVDIDGGGELDIDIDVDGDHDAPGGDDVSGGMLHAVFKFIGITDAPIILILSIFALLLWGMNMIANIVFNPGGAGGIAGMLLIPVVILSMVGTRLLVRPLRPVMKLIKGKEPPARTVGEAGVVKSATIDGKFGRVEISFDGKPLLLNAILSEEFPPLNKGASVLVVSKLDDSDIYVVRPL